MRRGLIQPDVSIPDDGFRFRHALIREAVYEAMPKAVRADLHETVAAQLDDADAEPAVVGYHLEHTSLLRRELGLRDPELAARAGRLLRLAAEETLSRTDAPATVSLLERARTLLPADDPELPAVLTGLGTARLNGGDVPGAESALVEAVDAAVALGQRATELHARIERQFVRAFAGETAVEESVALARGGDRRARAARGRGRARPRVVAAEQRRPRRVPLAGEGRGDRARARARSAGAGRRGDGRDARRAARTGAAARADSR